MPELIKKFLNFADEFDMLPESGLVLACVSGGADSMCLLEALLEIAPKRGFEVGAAHFNHGLRGEEADRDEQFVARQCKDRRVPFFLGCGDAEARARTLGMGIEAAARDMRYDFFYKTAGELGAKRIATGHTIEDNAETMLLNLARGSGAAGLSGIPPKRGTAGSEVYMIRPMLRISREEATEYLGLRGVPYVIDSTNELDIYARNKLRHRVVPVLRELNSRFSDACASSSELLRADEEFLSELAGAFIAERCQGGKAPSVGAGDLMNLPFAVSGRVIRRLFGGSLSLGHVKAVLRLCESGGPSARLSLPGMTVYRQYGRIVFGDASGDDAMDGGFDPIYPADGDCIEIPGAGLKITCKKVVNCDTINKSLIFFLFKCDDIYGRITVRPRREGDTIRLFGHSGTKTLKKLFIERRIPARKRAFIPIIADDAGVLAVYGAGMGSRAAPGPGDLAFLIEFEETDNER